MSYETVFTKTHHKLQDRRCCPRWLSSLYRCYSLRFSLCFSFINQHTPGFTSNVAANLTIALQQSLGVASALILAPRTIESQVKQLDSIYDRPALSQNHREIHSADRQRHRSTPTKHPNLSGVQRSRWLHRLPQVSAPRPMTSLSPSPFES